MKFSMIVACDKNRGIGRDNDLPWDLPTDMKYFKDTTASPNDDSGLQNAVIMGRRTYESLPINRRPLPRRLNVVLTRNEDYETPEGVIVANSLNEALKRLETYDLSEVFIIGGGTLYKEAIDHQECQKLYITEIDEAYECDTYFPEVPHDFKETSRSEMIHENNTDYEFVVYEKENS